MIGFRCALMLAALILVAPMGQAADMTLDPAKVANENVQLRTESDKFQDNQVWGAKRKMLGGTNFLTSLYANPLFVRSGQQSWYTFKITYQGQSWLFLSGKVIFLLDDGTRVVLDEPNAKVTTDVSLCSAYSCIITEEVRLAILPADLQRLAAAKTVEVAIYGRDKYTTGYFKPWHQATVIEILKFGEANGGMRILETNQ